MCVHPNSPWQGANFRLRPAANCRHQKVRITNTSKKHSPNFIPFSDTGYLPCGFAYISRHSHHTLFEVFSLASIVHFGLLSPPCTFPGILIIRHSKYRFFALSSTAGYLLSGLHQLPHPALIFSGIFPDPFYLLLATARRLPAHVTLVGSPEHFCCNLLYVLF